MITDNLLYPPFGQNTSIGHVEMPQMYDPKLTAKECRTLDWESFRDALEPMLTFSYPDDDGIQIAVTRKNSLWTPADVCCFVGGSRDIFTIEDMSIDEGRFFLLFNQVLATFLNCFSSNSQSHYKNITVAFGFNPEDFQLGAHSIKRLHTHIFTPHHRITDGDKKTPPYRTEKPWKEYSWFERLKIYEPFTIVYRDRLNYLLSQGLLSDYLSRDGIEENCGFLSLYLDAKRFNNFFPILQNIYTDLHQTYSGIERIYTDRHLGDNERFVPLPQEERVARLNEYMLESESLWLSNDSRELLAILSQRLKPANSREPRNNISRADQVWITKGFAGTILLQFTNDSDEIRLDICPRVLTTSAPEKLIYGKGRPTIITRVKRGPTEQELDEYRLYNLAVQVACKQTYEFLNGCVRNRK